LSKQILGTNVAGPEAGRPGDIDFT
jgi:hypothetical protein